MSEILPVDVDTGQVLRGRVLVQNTAIGPLILSLRPENGEAEAGFARKFDRTSSEILKAIAAGDLGKFNMSQPRIPAGQPGGGEWTSEGGEIEDVSTRKPHKKTPHKDKPKFVPMTSPNGKWVEYNPADLPKAATDALKQAMRLEHLPASEYNDMAWIMAQESRGQVGIHTEIKPEQNTAAGLFQLYKPNYHFYPRGSASLGNAVEECQGAIRYMRTTYHTAAKAKARWIYHAMTGDNGWW